MSESDLFKMSKFKGIKPRTDTFHAYDRQYHPQPFAKSKLKWTNNKSDISKL